MPKANVTTNDLEPPKAGQERYRLEVGHKHKVKPGNIVGAIANEAGLESQFIGQIKIFSDFSLVDLPEGMPKEIYKDLKKTRVSGQQLRISLFDKEQQRKPKSKKRSATKSRKRSDPKRKPKKKKHSD